jgi:hypothetical protein
MISAPPLRLCGGFSSVLVHEDTIHAPHEGHRRDAENAEEAQRILQAGSATSEYSRAYTRMK